MANPALLARRIAVLTLAVVPGASLAAAPAQKLDCAQLVPAAVVARLFPGGTVKPFQADQRTAVCNIALGGNNYAVQAFLRVPAD